MVAAKSTVNGMGWESIFPEKEVCDTDGYTHMHMFRKRLASDCRGGMAGERFRRRHKR